jgi:hypothetical protein
MSNTAIAGITAFLLGFCLMSCTEILQEKMFGCKQSPSQYCPTK